MVCELYSRLRDDQSYFARYGKSLMAEALSAVIDDLDRQNYKIREQRQRLAPAATATNNLDLKADDDIITVLKLYITKFRALAAELKQRGDLSQAVQENVKAMFLTHYLPKSLVELNLDKVVRETLDKYQADSLQFFAVILRDVLSCVSSSDLTAEIRQLIAQKVRVRLMQRLRSMYENEQDERSYWPAVVLQAREDERLYKQYKKKPTNSALLNRHNYWSLSSYLALVPTPE